MKQLKCFPNCLKSNIFGINCEHKDVLFVQLKQRWVNSAFEILKASNVIIILNRKIGFRFGTKIVQYCLESSLLVNWYVIYTHSSNQVAFAFILKNNAKEVVM